MSKIRILGAGGLAREIQAHLIREHNKEAYLVDSREADTGDDWTPTLIGIGDPKIKQEIDRRFSPCNWLSHYGYFGQSFYPAGQGLFVCPGVQATVNIKIGRHVLVNLNATIGHDTVVGDYCTINPGANISGNVTIGAGCLIGTGATIIEKVTIAPGTIIGAGAVVVSDITEPGTYVGVPAKRIK